MTQNPKLIFVALLLVLHGSWGFAQGTVDFYNTPATLVSAGPQGQESLISGTAGSYYFGLLIAPAGTADPTQFLFTGLYATNIGSSSPGRLAGSLVAPVPKWGIGASMSFLVAGWSASLGHDWSEKWITGSFDNTGVFGFSSISTGIAGGPGAPPISPLILFGGVTGIQSGWNLSPVPEPSGFRLLVIGLLVAVCFHLKKGAVARCAHCQET